MGYRGLVLLCVFSHGFLFASTCWPKRMVVSVPVADVRHKPQACTNLSYGSHDWLQTTQVLFGEKILAHEERNGWLRIRVLEQKVFVKGIWHCCSGWIKANQARAVSRFPSYNLVVRVPWATIYLPNGRKKIVSIGTQLYGTGIVKNRWKLLLPGGERGYISLGSVRGARLGDYGERALRNDFVKTALSFHGSPYRWGGRCAYRKSMIRQKQLTSVDCSGLVGLACRANGIDVPRNSPSIYRYCKKVASHPKRGDLVFLAHNKNPSSIHHVMIYMGGDLLLEARGSKARRVVKSICTERLGKPAHALISGQKALGGYLFLASIT